MFSMLQLFLSAKQIFALSYFVGREAWLSQFTLFNRAYIFMTKIFRADDVGRKRLHK